MKPFARELATTNGKKAKLSTQNHSQRVLWIGARPPYPDKTSVMTSRPTAKRTIRNAKRAQNKSARQRLKLNDTRVTADLE
jgi:hypothetical protein